MGQTKSPTSILTIGDSNKINVYNYSQSKDNSSSWLQSIFFEIQNKSLSLSLSDTTVAFWSSFSSYIYQHILNRLHIELYFSLISQFHIYLHYLH